MDQQNQNLFDLHVDHIVSSQLSEAAKWGRFIGIVGMIFSALFVLFGLFAGTLIGSMMPMMGGGDAAGMGMIGAGFFTFMFLIIALVYFFPALFLFRFGSQAQAAIKSNDQPKLQSSIKNLKACFRFMGILMIIGLAFYVLAFLGSLAGAAFM